MSDTHLPGLGGAGRVVTHQPPFVELLHVTAGLQRNLVGHRVWRNGQLVGRRVRFVVAQRQQSLERRRAPHWVRQLLLLLGERQLHSQRLGVLRASESGDNRLLKVK